MLEIRANYTCTKLLLMITLFTMVSEASKKIVSLYGGSTALEVNKFNFLQIKFYINLYFYTIHFIYYFVFLF